MPQLCVLYPGISLTTDKKNHGKTPVQVVEKYEMGTIHYVNMATFTQILPTSWLIPVYLGTLGRSGSTVSQRRHLLSCRNKGFPTPALVESNLLVRDLMRSAKNGTHKSS